MTREEAIEAIKNNYPDRKYSILREALGMAIEALKAEPKHGEWEYDGEYTRCSNCGVVLDTYMQGVFYTYCPNCGAKMDKSGDTK